jgi:hypothetical protein
MKEVTQRRIRTSDLLGSRYCPQRGIRTHARPIVAQTISRAYLSLHCRSLRSGVGDAAVRHCSEIDIWPFAGLDIVAALGPLNAKTFSHTVGVCSPAGLRDIQGDVWRAQITIWAMLCNDACPLAWVVL